MAVRAHVLRPGLAVLIAIVLMVCSPAISPPDGGQIDSGPSPDDADGDCISDVHEERASSVDTDQDGVPDYLDTDSDGDGIDDRTEARHGECDASRPPIDSDSDGTPDFRDLDSDANGIPDRDEGTEDNDGDGIPNRADLDDDGDMMTDSEEIGPDVMDPPDADLDGIPDYHDIDSDNDAILDLHERGADTDGDGLPDYQDTDSDDDGIPDSVEAGDTDLATPPFDTDGDLVPDFRDLDSDNDGLSDAWEWSHHGDVGTDFRDQDSDDDNVYDWIEVVAGTDPTNGMDSPRTRGDFVFIIPFEEPPEPPVDTLAFSTSLQLGDVFFALDLTASMDAELTSIRSQMTEIIDSVTCSEGEDPARTNCIPDLWVGFGWYTDAGGTGGSYRALEVDHNLTDDVAEVIASIPGATRDGSDECQRRAAYCTVHGPEAPYCPPAVTVNLDEYPCLGAGIGFPCFRPDAARLLVLITDEDMDQDPVPSYEEVADELLSAQLTFIGINAEETRDPGVTADLMEIAIRTASFDEAGEPLVFLGADTAVSDTVADAIRTVARVPLDVTVRSVGDVAHGIDPTEFIEYLEVNVSGEEPCTTWPDVRDSNGDHRDDTFIQISPGTPVCWDVHVLQNDIAPSTSEPQVFTATIEVRGGPGGTLLDSRDVYFLVPPETFIPPPD
jgi:hypothetical protein